MGEKKRQKQQKKVNEPQELVVVHRSMGLLTANVIKGKLASAGIPSVFKYESAGPVMGILVDGMGEVKVLVPKDLEQQALDVLKTG